MPRESVLNISEVALEEEEEEETWKSACYTRQKNAEKKTDRTPVFAERFCNMN